MRGKTVIVTLMKPGEPDIYNNRRLVVDEIRSVEDVLVAPDSTSSPIEDARPYALSTRIKLYFPCGSGLSGRLRGASISLEGKTYKIQGDPLAWPNVYGMAMEYDLEAEAVRSDG